MTQVIDALICGEMLNHLIDHAAKWHARLDGQPAAFLPRTALYPAHLPKNAAVPPAINVDINLENELQRTADSDFKRKRLHNRDYSPGGKSTPGRECK